MHGMMQHETIVDLLHIAHLSLSDGRHKKQGALGSEGNRGFQKTKEGLEYGILTVAGTICVPDPPDGAGLGTLQKQPQGTKIEDQRVALGQRSREDLPVHLIELGQKKNAPKAMAPHHAIRKRENGGKLIGTKQVGRRVMREHGNAYLDGRTAKGPRLQTPPPGVSQHGRREGIAHLPAQLLKEILNVVVGEDAGGIPLPAFSGILRHPLKISLTRLSATTYRGMPSALSTDVSGKGPLDPGHGAPFIKVCGNLHATDSLLVASFSPDFMGWIFSPFSLRRIERLRASHLIRRIRESHPRIRHVGVFAGNGPREILEIDRRLRRAGSPLDYLQVTEGIGFIARLRAKLRLAHGVNATPVVPVIRPTEEVGDRSFAFTAPSPFWILDRFDPRAKGGTGQRIPPEFFDASRPLRYPFLIAGGIRPENALQALRETGARGVDVSSGLELRPGVKDPALLEALFRALRPPVS